jgi:hypothetical protein
MTAQFHEKLIYDGDETSMAFCPPLPENHSRIVENSEKKEMILPGTGRMISSTACWREYIGTWEIKDGRFYLVKVGGRYRLNGDEPLFADWFSGVLRIPKGEVILYVHMGFGSVFEQEVQVKIEHGFVTKTKVVDNRGKEHDEVQLRCQNYPGTENQFPGDDEI